jgi:hypothetical protein
MSQNLSPQEKPRSPVYTMGLVPLAVGGEVGCLTILIVIVSLVAGLWLDRVLGTKPVFTLILLLGSAPFSLYLTFQLARRSVNRMIAGQPSPPGGAKPIKEEEPSE